LIFSDFYAILIPLQKLNLSLAKAPGFNDKECSDMINSSVEKNHSREAKGGLSESEKKERLNTFSGIVSGFNFRLESYAWLKSNGKLLLGVPLG